MQPEVYFCAMAADREKGLEPEDVTVSVSHSATTALFFAPSAPLQKNFGALDMVGNYLIKSAVNNMYRLYPCQAGYKTRYIPRESLSEAEEVPRAKPEALPRLHESFPKGYKGLISSLAGIQLTYTMLKSFRQELQGL